VLQIQAKAQQSDAGDTQRQQYAARCRIQNTQQHEIPFTVGVIFTVGKEQIVRWFVVPSPNKFRILLF
jgi:hypothetical protein